MRFGLYVRGRFGIFLASLWFTRVLYSPSVLAGKKKHLEKPSKRARVNNVKDIWDSFMLFLDIALVRILIKNYLHSILVSISPIALPPFPDSHCL